jgi:DNA-binding XRE family transcriptional regulator
MKFSEKVKYAREQLLLSQRALAKELGISYATVNMWETEKITPMWHSKENFYKYCKQHGILFDGINYDRL